MASHHRPPTCIWAISHVPPDSNKFSASLSALAGFLVAAGLYGSLSRRTSRDRALVLLAVATMLAGAVLGAWLVLRVSPAAALGVATGLLAVVTAGAAAAARRPGSWRRSSA